jgi:hypothetical protein
MRCSLQILQQGLRQQPPGGQARQCSGSGCFVVLDAWGNEGSCGQDEQMVPSLSIVLLTSGTYGSCGGQQYQVGNDEASEWQRDWLKLERHVLPL